jgi:hypothetical protein
MTTLHGVVFVLALLLVAPQPAARPGHAQPASTAATLDGYTDQV